MYSPSPTRRKFLFFKIPIIVKFGVGDGLCISKMIIPLENINLIGKCYEDLLLYSPSTTRHKFLSFKIPIIVKFGIGDGLCIRKWVFIWKILIWLINVMRIYYCTRLAQRSTILFSKIPIFVKFRFADGLCISKMSIQL